MCEECYSSCMSEFLLLLIIDYGGNSYCVILVRLKRNSSALKINDVSFVNFYDLDLRSKCWKLLYRIKYLLKVNFIIWIFGNYYVDVFNDDIILSGIDKKFKRLKK